MEFLAGLDKRLRGKRILILGVGNSLRGDDGLGSALAVRLDSHVNARVIDAGDVPENFIGPIIAADPEVLMIVDAANINAPAGSMAIIETEHIANASLSTHSSSLNLFLLVLRSEIDPDVFILGIQPESTAFGASMSQPVRESLVVIEKALLKILTPE